MPQFNPINTLVNSVQSSCLSRRSVDAVDPEQSGEADAVSPERQRWSRRALIAAGIARDGALRARFEGSPAANADQAQQPGAQPENNIKEVLRNLGHKDRHPLWTALEQRSGMGDTANDFTEFLETLYNQAPRKNGKLKSRINQHIAKVLKTMEWLHNQAKQPEIEEILNHANGAAVTCVDRAAIHLLLMSAKSQYYKSGNQKAMDDVKTIEATMSFVSRLNKNNESKLCFDNDSKSFKPFIEVTGNNYQIFLVEDEVEDILQLLNSGLLKAVNGCDMNYGDCVTLDEREYIKAAKKYITG